MKIKYREDNIGFCLDQCPFNKIAMGNDIKVGSCLCSECKHHFKSGELNTILCNCKNDLKIAFDFAEWIRDEYKRLEIDREEKNDDI